MSEHNTQSPIADSQSAPPFLSVLSESQRESVIARLEDAAETGDEIAFLSAVKELEGEELSAADFIRVIRLAHAAGAYLAAREFSARGASIHSSDSELQKCARVLAPPKVIGRGLPARPDIKANGAWMKQHGHKYRGQWVAVRNGQLLGAAASLDDLVNELGETKDVLLTIAY